MKSSSSNLKNNMKFKNVLVLYKRSAYKIYFLEKRSALRNSRNTIVLDEARKFKAAHDSHYETLHSVAKVLLTNGVRFTECYRGRRVNYNDYDMIITIGGDGTFLEASKHIKKQVLLGVNSAPNYSVGRFCIAHLGNFEPIIKNLQSGKYKIIDLHRMRLKVSKYRKKYDVLNDILICHQNPAFLCRYYLRYGGLKEEQRSSGVWVSTPAGSSGAIKSAGGQVIPIEKKELQYLPRELYRAKRKIDYRLKGGIIKPRQKMTVTSLMRKGMIYLDGAHSNLHFDFGSQCEITLSPHSIRTIKV